jgi:hypothetical protein
MKHRACLVTATAAAVALFGTSVRAQNLVGNGDFDTHVLGWTPFAISFEWDSEDHLQSPMSGSLKATNANPGVTTSGLFACVNGLVAGQSYDLRGWSWIPPGQIGHGAVGFGVYWYDSTDCLGTLLAPPDTTPLIQVADGWISLARFGLVAPSAAQSGQVTIFNTKYSLGTDPFVAHYDAVFLGVIGGIFTDGFESGATGLWSSTVP